jgi:hypothetical protein
MDRRGSVELVILAVVAVVALIGLIMLFKGATADVAGQPRTRQVLPTSEEFRIERPGGYTCVCSGMCVYDQRIESAKTAVTENQMDAVNNCKATLQNRCRPQDMLNFRFSCETR